MTNKKKSITIIRSLVTTVNKKDKTKTYPVSYTQWEDIEVGDVLEAKVNLIGTIEILEKE